MEDKVQRQAQQRFEELTEPFQRVVVRALVTGCRQVRGLAGEMTKPHWGGRSLCLRGEQRRAVCHGLLGMLSWSRERGGGWVKSTGGSCILFFLLGLDRGNGEGVVSVSDVRLPG
ncbi:hypothetical protein GCM10010439_51610 [Actinocorallia aurantiaca]|uniref:Uncharacterized protein n=1 Tax=Actinocorallia aurantiaca TaxID=46204 RepID=A0ABP6GZ99_9ACTN